MKRLFAFLYVGLVMSMVGAGSAVAQTASALYEFGGGGSGDGDEPTVLIQAQDGNFYGITAYGGNASGCTDDNGVPTGCGTIFKISPGGSESVLYKFSGGTDGGIPNSLIQGPDGNIYGTTLIGGQPPSSPNQCNISSPSNPGQTAGPCCPPDSNGDAVGCGTIFVFAPTQAASVTPTTLYSFTGTADGGSPGTLIVGTNSSGARLIFGTTLSCSNCFYPSSSGLFYPTGGTIFSFALPVSTPFKPNTLATFSTQLAEFPKLGTNANLAFPNSLIQTDQNTLYGTTQMGGVTSTGQNAVCQTEFGCGGVFELELASSNLVDICHFGDLIDVTPPAIGACNSADVPQPASLPQAQAIEKSGKPSPEIIVAQSGVRFPTGGSLWGFTTEPIALVADSSGNIYGTTPPGCVDPSYSLPYTSDPNCASDHPDDFVNAVQGTVFELTPSTGSVTFPYSFSGNGPSPTSPPSDGGGSEAGITLATDGNFYGLSGDGASSFYGLSGVAGLSSEVFELPVLDGNLTNYTSLSNPNLVGSNPNWMIQGSNGNFYGTSSTELFVATCGLLCGSGTRFGSVFQVTPPSPLNPPVGLSFNSPQIALGNPATLTWTVPYAYSLTSRQCYAFVEGTNASTAGAWSGLQSGSLSNKVYGGSIAITPTAFGNYTYALTCGGIVSGQATLQVFASQAASPSFNPVGGNYNRSQSVTITDSTPGATIYYTTNGIKPTTSSTMYDGPVGVSSNETLEAIAAASGYAASSVSTVAYTFPPPETTLSYSFMGGTDGEEPNSLIQAQDGNYYGTTVLGGNALDCKNSNVAIGCCLDPNSNSIGCGTVFRLNLDGTETVIYSFSGGSDGGEPTGLIQGPDGNLWGTTSFGGEVSTNTNCAPVGCGVIFEINPAQPPATGQLLSPVYKFSGASDPTITLPLPDGAYPNPLTLGAGGVFYGTSIPCSACNKFSYGFLFSFTPGAGSPFTTLSTFGIVDKQENQSTLDYPNALIQVDANTLYGTTLMGGDTSGCLNTGSGWGCGGVFTYVLSGTNAGVENDVCYFGESNNLSSSSRISTPDKSRTGEPQFGPEIVVVQSSGRFPANGQSTWTFNSAPMTIALGADGNIYGASPPLCVTYALGGAGAATLSLTSSCSSSSYFAPATVFQCVPPAAPLAKPLSLPTGTSNTIYSFTGSNDGGGSLQGLILASDGHYYGTSGVYTFDLTPMELASYTSTSSTAPLDSLSPFYATQTTDTTNFSPNSMIQGDDGNFYGTSATGGNNSDGTIFEVSTPLPPPVQLSFTESSIAPGNSSTLGWVVRNATSLTSQQCYAFIEGTNASTAGNWSQESMQSATSISGGVLSGSISIAPTAPTAAGHPYTYALTCGGIVTGLATLQVNAPALTIAPSSVPAGTAGTPYSQSLTPGGGSGTGYQFSITVGGSTLTALGLSLSTAGVISGTPTGGTATFTVQLTDSLNDSTTQAYTLIVNKVTPTVTWTPASTIIHGGAGSNVLNASANTSGSFTYAATPTGGGSAINITSGTSALAVGSYNLAANFTPTATSVYNSAQATATLLVSGESVWIVDGTGGLSELAGNGYGITSSADPGANLAVAIDSSGNVWTVGSGSTLLEETSQAGTSLTTIVSGTGGLSSPKAIAIDGNGQMWITNGDNSVSLFSNGGTALSPSAGFTGATLSMPSGVAVDLSGSVWITNKGSNSVTRILGAAAPAAPLSTAAENKTTGEKP